MTIASLVADWNAAIEGNKQIVDNANAALQDQFDRGTISGQALIKGLKPSPQPLKAPPLAWSKWFLRTWGWSMLSRQSDAQASLPYDHWDMKHAREKVASLASSMGVHPALIINWDQLWRASWQFGGKLLWKPRSATGKRIHRQKAPKRIEKKLHAVKGARRSITEAKFHLAFFSCLFVC